MTRDGHHLNRFGLFRGDQRVPDNRRAAPQFLHQNIMKGES
jgi:hypothetical protein